MRARRSHGGESSDETRCGARECVRGKREAVQTRVKRGRNEAVVEAVVAVARDDGVGSVGSAATVVHAVCFD